MAHETTAEDLAVMRYRDNQDGRPHGLMWRDGILHMGTVSRRATNFNGLQSVPLAPA